MAKVILLDATMRSDSRTKALAHYYLKASGIDDFSIYPLVDLHLQLSVEDLQRRTELVAARNYDDPLFNHAKAFASADEIIIAAPVYDLSFPACLKTYIEAINVPGIVFEYGEHGNIIPKTKAKHVTYITTSGGPIISDVYGYGYIRAFFQTFCGLEDVRHIKAEGLDAFPEQIEQRLAKAKESIIELIGCQK